MTVRLPHYLVFTHRLTDWLTDRGSLKDCLTVSLSVVHSQTASWTASLGVIT